MTRCPTSDASSSGLLIRLWHEPGAGPRTDVRARLLAVRDGADPEPLAAYADESKLAEAVQRWLDEECRALRGDRSEAPTGP